MSTKKIQILTPIVTSVNGEFGDVTVDMKKLGIEAALDKKSNKNHTHNYAGSDEPGGAATSANKLTKDAGTENKPVYFKNGVPVALPYTIDKSVPADAIFTDTTYDIGNNTTAGVAKLYDSAGANLDGAMTQKATQTLFDGKATISKTVPVTLLASGWSGNAAPYTYNLSVTGVTAFSNQEIIPATNITQEQLISLQGTNMIDGGQSDGKIILKATKNKPTVDIPMRVILRGDAVQPPVKGDIITMDLGNGNKGYRVLKMDGSVAEVLAMYRTEYTISSSKLYAGGNLDTTLNTTFYNSLSTAAKAAIVPKNIIQYEYKTLSTYDKTSHSSLIDYSAKQQRAIVGDRYIYALDVEDIEIYFNGVFGQKDIWKLFDNKTSEVLTFENPYLRSGLIGYSSVCCINSRNGYIDYDKGSKARPAFQIDLSKIPFTKV